MVAGDDAPALVVQELLRVEYVAHVAADPGHVVGGYAVVGSHFAAQPRA
jgi:hypothetical protein